MIEVLQPGMLSTIQDAGRKGFEAYGVAPSGTFDPFLASVANKLVGNSSDQPLLEFALVGPSLRFSDRTSVAVTGLDIRYQYKGNGIPDFHAIQAEPGSELRFIGMAGWYGYIAIGGGIETTAVLDSSSTYLAGGIGSRIQKGMMLKTGSSHSQLFSMRERYWTFPDEPLLYLLPSVHSSRFSERERNKITQHVYKINPQSNRMGIRLDGAALDAPVIRRSAPAVQGTVQVPKSGLPIILGPEGPTTGGYAQLGAITATSWTVLAGRKPGESLRLEWTDLETARRMWDFRQKLLRTESAWKPA